MNRAATWARQAAGSSSPTWRSASGSSSGRSQMSPVTPVLDHLGHRAAAQRHHRGTAGHRLDHHHPERLLPLDGEQQAAGAGEQPALGGRVGDAEHMVGRAEPRLRPRGQSIPSPAAPRTCRPGPAACRRRGRPPAPGAAPCSGGTGPGTARSPALSAWKGQVSSRSALCTVATQFSSGRQFPLPVADRDQRDVAAQQPVVVPQSRRRPGRGRWRRWAGPAPAYAGALSGPAKVWSCTRSAPLVAAIRVDRPPDRRGVSYLRVDLAELVGEGAAPIPVRTGPGPRLADAQQGHVWPGRPGRRRGRRGPLLPRRSRPGERRSTAVHEDHP